MWTERQSQTRKGLVGRDLEDSHLADALDKPMEIVRKGPQSPEPSAVG